MPLPGFMKKLSSLVPAHDLKYLLHSHLNVKEPERSTRTMHASEVTKEGFCPRYYALMDTTDTAPPARWVTTSDQVTWRIGRVLQDAVVEWCAEMGRVIGHWACLGCGKVHEFQARPTKCDHCRCRAFAPEEVRITSTESGISGGFDMLISLSPTKLRVVEIKTIDKDKFKELVAPLAEHRIRTALYLRLVAECDHPWAKRIDTKSADILYVTKGGFGCQDDELKGWGLHEVFSPFKRFTIKHTDADTDELCRQATVVKQFRDGTAGMPEGICHTALDKRAKACAACKACFSGDYPAENLWRTGE